MSILEKIKGHADLQMLSDEERQQLCQQIRQFLVTHVSRTGGHLASNLGVVELTVAIETVFNTEKDRLVFDVGHQSYVHKLLTGRQAGFDSLRSYGGMAGFPKPSESDADAFVAGHSSASVSVALGMARARTLTKQDYHVVALLGDGAATGGMVYEGLSDAAVSREPMVIILNDNEMSIDRNVGGLARHLSKLRTKERYLNAKQTYRNILGKLPGGKVIYRVTSRMKDWLRRMLIPATVFENMGLSYFGPVDGHDLPRLITLLQTAKEMGRPVVVHVITQKGKGYLPAEEDPAKYHGVGTFDPYTGKVPEKTRQTYSDGFGQALCRLAKEDPRVCAITAAMPGGTGLLEFQKQFPKRTFDVGIAEEHAVSMAGGLAKQGMIPVVALYSTFLQRSYDMLLQDVAMLGLHVVFAVDRAGLVGEDGETHHGVFDTGFLRQIPGMRVLCPGSIAEQQAMLHWAICEQNGPVAIRYPRGGEGSFTENNWPKGAHCHRMGDRTALITYGSLLDNALEAARLLEAEGVSVSVIRLLSLKPLPIAALEEMLAGHSNAVVLEEAVTGSGVRETLSWQMQQRLPGCRFRGIDLGTEFVPHGDMASLLRHCGLDAESVKNYVLEVVRGEN